MICDAFNNRIEGQVSYKITHIKMYDEAAKYIDYGTVTCNN